jgi:hypothetical protein
LGAGTTNPLLQAINAAKSRFDTMDGGGLLENLGNLISQRSTILDLTRCFLQQLAIFSQSAVIELDRTGKTVWRYETPGYNPFLARKR